MFGFFAVSASIGAVIALSQLIAALAHAPGALPLEQVAEVRNPHLRKRLPSWVKFLSQSLLCRIWCTASVPDIPLTSDIHLEALCAECGGALVVPVSAVIFTVT